MLLDQTGYRWIEERELFQIIAGVCGHEIAQWADEIQSRLVRPKSPIAAHQIRPLASQSSKKVLKDGIEPGSNDVWARLFPAVSRAFAHSSATIIDDFWRLV